MSKLFHSILAGVLLLIGLATQAHAAKRVALVVGNSSYREAPLVNPVKDADAVSAMLKSLQFDVTTLKDVSKQQFEDAVDRVCGGLAEGDVCLIYYAGHGQSLGEENYLVPVDAVVDQPQHVELRCVSVNYLLASLRYSGCSLKIVVVDACRNNPFRGFFRSKPGLRKLAEAPEGTIVSFSTSPGTVALDGRGENSPFARHFVSTFQSQAGEKDILHLFANTGRAVRNDTGQRPHLTMDISMPEFYLKPRSVAPDSRMDRTPPTTLSRSFTNSVGMKFNLIPAGTFLMGSPESEKDRDDDEVQHQVTISQPYYLQTTEVTQGQWMAVMGTKLWEGEVVGREGSDSAASYVSWDDAVEFCRKLSMSDPDHNYRLPTEAEWEYACRAGSRTAFSFGADETRLSDYGWWGGVVGGGNCQQEQYAHEVGGKRPNAFGLYDMHGNVYEWCSDWYEEDYYASSPGTDPQGPSSGSSRVVRGGSWYGEPYSVRSAFRARSTPGYRGSDGGFRVLCESD